MLECRLVSPSHFFSTLSTYHSLIIDSAWENLQSVRDKDANWLIIELLMEKQLVGLTLVEIYTESNTAQFLSIVIKENYRQQGLGLFLFQFTQNFLSQNRQIRAIALNEEVENPLSIALEKILDHLNWKPPHLYLIRCFYNHVPAFAAPWMFLSYQFPPEMTVFTWNLISEQERELITFQENQGRFLPYLSPFKDEHLIDYQTSLGLRYKGQIIGWCINHCLDADTIRYSVLYIDKDYQAMGYAIFLLIEAIKRQQQSNIRKAVFEINLEQIDPTWHRFVYRRLIPYADHISRFKWAFHSFI